MTRTSRLDRLSLWGIVVGVVVMLQPWWGGGLRAGFLLTAAATLLQTVASRVGSDDRR